ncbi:MAG: hypothetical protein IJ743_00515 [Bacilli bacterium]|nr:hypothetical protein [Methanobrevibacter sp.]MBR1748258.1 hypothetical protein [Bacilli bacterium]
MNIEKHASVKSDSENFLFTAPVMIPGRPDCDYPLGEKPFTADEIRFLKESFDDYQLIDKEHQVFKDIPNAETIGEPVDSFILAENTTYKLADGTHETYPVGTWMLTSNITDSTAQEEILAGNLTGWSPSTHRKEVADLIRDAMSTKSRTLVHDIKDPRVVTVSLVKKPCQSGSKQCKLNGSVKMSDEKKTLDKIREILNLSPEGATKSDLDALAEQLRKENADAIKSMEDSLSETMANSIKEALAPLGSLKAKPDDDDDDDDSEGEEGEEGAEEGNEAPAPEDDDDEKKKRKAKGKGKSKTPPVHDGDSGSTKSNEDLDTYAFLGRNPDGTRKRN